MSSFSSKDTSNQNSAKDSKFVELVNSVIKFAEKETEKEDRCDVGAWIVQNEDAVINNLLGKNARIPKRIIIIAYAVAAKLNVRDANKLLRKNNTEELYVRNLSDLVIMRSLELKRSPAELCELMKKVAPVLEALPHDNSFMEERKSKLQAVCTIEKMEAYLDNSRTTAHTFEANLKDVEYQAAEIPTSRMIFNAPVKLTKQLTSELEQAFAISTSEDDSYFLNMISENIEKFSDVRERTRREFVKALCHFCRAINEKSTIDAQLALFDNVKTEQIKDKRPVNFNSLAFDINEFYQGALFHVEEGSYSHEDHSDYETYDSKKIRNDWFVMNGSAEDREQDKAQGKFSDIMHDFLQGKSDISRTLFIAVMLYFSAKTNEALSVRSLNEALSKCGWRQINIKSKEALDCLTADVLAQKYDSYGVDLDLMERYAEEGVFVGYEGKNYSLTRDREIRKTILNEKYKS